MSTQVLGLGSGSVVARPVQAGSTSVTPGVSAGTSSVGGAEGQPVLQAFRPAIPVDEQLFSDYATGAWSSTCWAAPWDFSGVGWEGSSGDERRVTLIGRNCFACAHHYSPSVGATITFTDPIGTTHTYTIAAISDEITVLPRTYDGRVGTFTTTVSDTLASYAIETDLEVDDYLVATRSRASLASRTPTTQRAMIERVSSFEYGTTPHPNLRWLYTGESAGSGLPADVIADYETASTGDSGDALFTVSGGALHLVSTYHGVSNGPYYGHPDLLAEVDTWLTANGGARLAQASVVEGSA